MSEITAPASPLLATLIEAGGVTGDYHGRTLVRHFGDPAGEYAAATGAVAVFDRSHRTRLLVTGRAPDQMLSGVLTGRMPAAPRDRDGGRSGRGSYHAVLTPKGKMISDLVAFRLGDEETQRWLLDVPVAGVEGLLEHFGRFLPPRFAAVQNVGSTTAAITVTGPGAATLLSKYALGLRVEAAALEAATEEEWYSASGDPDALIVARTAEVWPAAWTVYGPVDGVGALWRALVESGARPAGLGVWSTLRVEAGRPVFGTDMDDGTLPPEAGIVDRAIDQTKGCYTGQEVIVRIRDRGHVNRRLRRLHLGDVPAPGRGAELLADDGSGKVVGHLTSVVQSPRFGEVVALGYVRRGVRRVRLGDLVVEVPDEE